MNKRGLLCLLICFVMFFCGSCSALSALLPEVDTALWVAFSSSDARNNLAFHRVSELENYSSVYREYSSDVYYATLDDDGKRIYRLLEYALDNCITRIMFDERLADDLVETLPRVMVCLALDSPLVEQNLSQRYYSVSETQVASAGPFDRERPVKGILLKVVGFSRNALDLKEHAVAKARQIVDGLPEGLTPAETCWSLYRYLRENVSYRTYDNTWKACYLYDALCEGASHCDGFANAFSLLCNMAGVPCFEKLHLPTDEEQTGHTWNCVRLDGAWFNVDAAVDSSDVEEIERRIGQSFWYGFSDEYQTGPVYLADRLPVCDRDMLELSFTASGEDDLVDKIVSAFRRGNSDYVYFALDSTPAGPDVWQRVSDTLRAGITWVMLNESVPYRYVVCLS